jgi:hypothetical protein
MSCSFVNRVRVRLDAVDSELPVLALEETLVDEDVREKVGGIGEGKEGREARVWVYMYPGLCIGTKCLINAYTRRVYYHVTFAFGLLILYRDNVLCSFYMYSR